MRRYRIRNTTKNQWAYADCCDPPTEDPDNPGDSVDLDSVVIVERSIPHAMNYSYDGALDGDDSTYSTESYILFPGTYTVGVPTKIEAVMSIDQVEGQNDKAGVIRIYDSTNNEVIVEKTVNGRSPAIWDLGELGNITESSAIWEVQLKKTTGEECKCYSICIFF